MVINFQRPTIILMMTLCQIFDKIYLQNVIYVNILAKLCVWQFEIKRHVENNSQFLQHLLDYS